MNELYTCHSCKGKLLFNAGMSMRNEMMIWIRIGYIILLNNAYINKNIWMHQLIIVKLTIIELLIGSQMCINIMNEWIYWEKQLYE